MLKSNPSHTTKLEESKTYEVYFIESTDHWYVGCTTRTTPVRFAQHLAPSSDAPIGKLAKQGIEFTWSVLERAQGTTQTASKPNSVGTKRSSIPMDDAL